MSESNEAAGPSPGAVPKEGKSRNRKKKPRKGPRSPLDALHQGEDDVVIEEEVTIAGSRQSSASTVRSSDSGPSVDNQQPKSRRNRKKKQDGPQNDFVDYHQSQGPQGPHRPQPQGSYSSLRGQPRPGSNRGRGGHYGPQGQGYVGQGHMNQVHMNQQAYLQEYASAEYFNAGYDQFQQQPFYGMDNRRGHSQPYRGQMNWSHNSPRGHHNSPRGHHNSPRDHHNSPRGHHNTPRGHRNSPRGQHTPRGQGQRGHHRGGPHGGRHPNLNLEGDLEPVNEGHQNNPGSEKRRGHQNRRKQGAPKQAFEPYWTMEKVQEGLKRGQLIQGKIRINPKNFEDAYVPHPDGKSDIYLGGLHTRNRALEADVVVIQINPREEWKVLMDEVEYCANSLAENLKGLRVGASEFEKTPGGAKDGGATIDSKEVITDGSSKKEDSELSQLSQSDSEKKGSVDDKDSLLAEVSDDAKSSDLSESQETAVKSENETQKSNSDSVDQSVDSKKKQDVVVGESTSKTDSQPAEIEEKSESSTVSNSDNQEKTQQRPSSGKKSKKNKKDQKDSKTDISKNPNGQQSNATKTPGSAKKNANTPRKRYTSLQDIVMSPSTTNSDAVKRLFDDSYEGRLDENQVVTEMDKKVMAAVPDKYLLRTGKVVYIVEKVHSRAFTGHIKLMNDKNKDRALFCPNDHRMPRLFVPMSQCPPDFYERSEDYSQTLFVGRMTDWRENSQFAEGELAKSLGEAGEIEPETEGLLISYGIDFAEFPDQAIDCLPKASPEAPWIIPQEEYRTRRDLRNECIFTIDPATARDLDDALHCKPLGNGLYEVGVHIADVSYFVEFANALDKVARSRSTSVYLVQRVIPMLPRLLCEKLCSLNPDEDRLTFSVIWKLNANGGVVDEWFGRTVIKSCAKLSYDHAQGFINEPGRHWLPEELPAISKGFSIPMIVEKVLDLHRIAQKLRQRRFDEGALRLDQVKLEYTLDKETGLPNGYKVYKQRESNKLVEEFMLLANMAVAHQIYKNFPELALLRRHPPPQEKMIADLELQCDTLGVQLDCSSAGAIHESIASLAGDDIDSQARQQILVVLCSKPMQNALYFCTGCLEDEELYRHYALNVPLYTHFTSPIRRYPDIMVHRLLAASLGYCSAPPMKKGDVECQGDHSNRKKNDSKKIQDASCELFFAAFVKACGPLEEKGMVMGVLDKAIDVLILQLGVVKRVYMEQLPLRDFSFSKHQKTPKLKLLWAISDNHQNERHQALTIFSRVNCVLSVDDKRPMKWNASIKHPDEE